MGNKILLVINPIAGGTGKEYIKKAVHKKASKIQYGVELYETTGKGDGQAVLSLMDNEHFSRILIAGGDGTIREIADAVRKKDILIGILPSGSANGLALNLGIPDDLEGQLQIAFAEDYIAMDMLEINGQTGLHISDLGVNAALIKNYEASDIRGKLGYLLQTIPTLAKSNYPFQVRVKANGEQYMAEAILVAIANAQKFGTGANINPTGQLNDGQFEVLLFKNFDIPEIIKTFYGPISHNSEFVTVIKTKEAVIKTATAIPFQIDGEYMGAKTEIIAKVQTEKLKVLARVH